MYCPQESAVCLLRVSCVCMFIDINIAHVVLELSGRFALNAA